MSMETINFLYLLELEINGSEAGHLNDALEEEEFPMRDVLGESELKSQIASGQLSFLAESTESFYGIAKPFSVYLLSFQPTCVALRS